MLIDITIRIEGDTATDPRAGEAWIKLASLFSPQTEVAAEPEKPKTTRSRAKAEPKPETTPEPEADPAPETEPDAEPATAEPEETEPEAPTVTLEEVRAKLAGLAQGGKQAQVKELLGKFGASKLTEVPAEKYAELLAAAEEDI